jgi:hypothetical protein
MKSKITVVKSNPPIEWYVNEVVHHSDCNVEFLKKLVLELNQIIELNELENG